MASIKRESNKILRSLCGFAAKWSPDLLPQLDEISQDLRNRGFEVQTRRLCLGCEDIRNLLDAARDETLYLSIGAQPRERIPDLFDDWMDCDNVSFHLDLTHGAQPRDTEILFEIIRRAPSKTFNFAYTFCNPASSPFFPSAAFKEPGFAVGLQPTDLSEGCPSLEPWLERMKEVWTELMEILGNRAGFLGIDSSVAPLFSGKSSLIHFVSQVSGSFSKAVTTDFFLRISRFIREENPRPIGLCGVMLPCLEDFELAAEYEAGRFSIERNLYLSLHSGLGIDTYPVGIDEPPQRVFEILKLMQGLAVKYRKPLSARFVSDGKARVGDRTDFKNPYLKDVTVRPL